MKALLPLLILSILITSCVNTKRHTTIWLPGKQTIYFKIEHRPLDPNIPLSTTTVAYSYPLAKGMIARINKDVSEKSADRNELVIYKDGKAVHIPTGLRQDEGETTSQFLPTKFFFPLDLDPKSSRKTGDILVGEKLKYWEMKPVWLAASIPLKIRPKLTSAPYSAEGSTNLGLAHGWKFSKKSFQFLYDEDKKFLSRKVREFSLTPAGFIGPTLVKLNSTRSLIGAQGGALIVAGINQISIGLAGGVEYAFDAKKDWPYHGKHWFGFVFTLDFIK